jgi:hypothetical protein
MGRGQLIYLGKGGGEKWMDRGRGWVADLLEDGAGVADLPGKGAGVADLLGMGWGGGS